MNTGTTDGYIAHLENEIDRLRERCIAYKGQVKAGSEEIDRLKHDLERHLNIISDYESGIAQTPDHDELEEWKRAHPPTEALKDLMRHTWKAKPTQSTHLIRNDALEEAARIAENGCLVPPDGGAPTEAEREMCESIASAIRKLVAPVPSPQSAQQPEAMIQEIIEDIRDMENENVIVAKMRALASLPPLSSPHRTATLCSLCGEPKIAGFDCENCGP